ncbi:MAG: hypothetical protein EXQ58_12935 [Acidobacteria bacterium]|nr:hypothetical protein [Acidobacteriota bacterium]
MPLSSQLNNLRFSPAPRLYAAGLPPNSKKQPKTLKKGQGSWLQIAHTRGLPCQYLVVFRIYFSRVLRHGRFRRKDYPNKAIIVRRIKLFIMDSPFLIGGDGLLGVPLSLSVTARPWNQLHRSSPAVSPQ